MPDPPYARSLSRHLLVTQLYTTGADDAQTVSGYDGLLVPIDFGRYPTVQTTKNNQCKTGISTIFGHFLFQMYIRRGSYRVPLLAFLPLLLHFARSILFSPSPTP